MTDTIEEAEEFYTNPPRWLPADVRVMLANLIAAARADREARNANAVAMSQAVTRADAESATVLRVVAERDALRAELAETKQERDTEADAVTEQRETIKSLRAELAAVTAERDEALQTIEDLRLEREIVQYGELTRRAEAAESALARAMEAMPSGRVQLMLAAAVPHHPLFSEAMRAECMEAISRMSDAYRADQQQNGGDHG